MIRSGSSLFLIVLSDSAPLPNRPAAPLPGLPTGSLLPTRFYIAGRSEMAALRLKPR
jgi:hypothetical protein